MPGLSLEKNRGAPMSYANDYLNATAAVVNAVDRSQIEKLIDMFLAIRSNKGRLFFLGVGGSAANCTHAVNDFRKIGVLKLMHRLIT
jgi:D-sedoheptulose 7-phosphate isomerase